MRLILSKEWQSQLSLAAKTLTTRSVRQLAREAVLECPEAKNREVELRLFAADLSSAGALSKTDQLVIDRLRNFYDLVGETYLSERVVNISCRYFLNQWPVEGVGPSLINLACLNFMAKLEILLPFVLTVRQQLVGDGMNYLRTCKFTPLNLIWR